MDDITSYRIRPLFNSSYMPPPCGKYFKTISTASVSSYVYFCADTHGDRPSLVTDTHALKSNSQIMEINLSIRYLSVKR